MINLSGIRDGLSQTERYLNEQVFSEETIQNVQGFFNREVFSAEAVDRMASTALKAAAYATVAFMIGHIVWFAMTPILAAKIAFGSYVVHSLIGRICDLASTPDDSEFKRTALKIINLASTWLIAALMVPTPFWIRQAFVYKLVVALDLFFWTNLGWHALTTSVLNFTPPAISQNRA